MSTGALIAIIVVVLVIVIALAVALPRARARRLELARERELERRRTHVISEHRDEATARAQSAERAERRARIAEQEARRERAEAELHEERAAMHEQGLADEELMDDDAVLDRDGQRRPDRDLAAGRGSFGERESAVGAEGGAVADGRVPANPERQR